MIPTRVRKLLGDVLERRARSVLTLLGLAIGLYGLCSVLVSFVILSGDLDANYRNTNPPRVILDTGIVPAATRERLRALPGVDALESRLNLPARVELSPGRWMGMQLFVVEDFDDLRVARFRTESGAWPPPTGGLLIERDSRFFLRAPIGTVLRLRLPDGRTVSTPLSGLTFDPGQAPARMEQTTYGYVSRATLAQWGFEPTRDRLLLSSAAPGTGHEPGLAERLHGRAPDAGHDTAPGGEARGVRELAQGARLVLERDGVALRRVELNERLVHPHQFQLDSILALLGGLALVSLLMCVVLVVNLIDSIMTSEQRAIGVLKAIGGTTRQIARDYLLGMAVIGLGAGLLSLPFALRTGRLLARFAALSVNFELLTPQGPPWVVLVVLGVAVGVPVAVAARRVLRTASLPVREALSRSEPGQSHAYADGFGALLGPLPVLVRIALRSVARQPRRALLTAGSLALGLAFFATALNVRTSLMHTVVEVQRSRPSDLEIVFREAYPIAELQDWVRGFPAIRTTDFWLRTSGTLARDGHASGGDVQVAGVPRESDTLKPFVIAGQWLDVARPDGVVANQRLLVDLPELEVGGRYRLQLGERAQDVTLVGVIKEFGQGRLYASRDLIESGTDLAGRANVMQVTLAEGGFGGVRETGGKLEASLVDGPWQVASTQTSRLVEAIVRSHLDVIAGLMLLVAAIALAVGALGLASSISVSVVERTREIGVLKAIGGRSRAIALLFACEAVVVGLLGAGIALALAPVLSRRITTSFGNLVVGYPFEYDPAPYVVPAALLVAVLTALLASSVPIRAALRTTPHRALRAP